MFLRGHARDVVDALVRANSDEVQQTDQIYDPPVLLLDSFGAVVTV